jgi:hypothetical protein
VILRYRWRGNSTFLVGAGLPVSPPDPYRSISKKWEKKEVGGCVRVVDDKKLTPSTKALRAGVLSVRAC